MDKLERQIYEVEESLIGYISTQETVTRKFLQEAAIKEYLPNATPEEQENFFHNIFSHAFINLFEHNLITTGRMDIDELIKYMYKGKPDGAKLLLSLFKEKDAIVPTSLLARGKEIVALQAAEVTEAQWRGVGRVKLAFIKGGYNISNLQKVLAKGDFKTKFNFVCMYEDNVDKITEQYEYDDLLKRALIQNIKETSELAEPGFVLCFPTERIPVKNIHKTNQLLQLLAKSNFDSRVTDAVKYTGKEKPQESLKSRILSHKEQKLSNFNKLYEDLFGRNTIRSYIAEVQGVYNKLEKK